MGCGAEAQGVCPASFIETEDWELEDPKGKSLEQVRKIRDEIRDRVSKLIGQNPEELNYVGRRMDFFGRSIHFRAGDTAARDIARFWATGIVFSPGNGSTSCDFEGKERSPGPY
jgi:hypothetical protein